jgi:hypothetical protein
MISNGFLLSDNNTLTPLNLPISLPISAAKNKALVVETKDKVFTYAHRTYSTITDSHIDTIVFLSDLDDDNIDNTASNSAITSQEITKADLLKNIWENTHDQNSEKINLVSQWIDSIDDCFHIKGKKIDDVYHPLLTTLSIKTECNPSALTFIDRY